MKVSEQREDELKKKIFDHVHTNDVPFTDGDKGSDCKAEVMLCFGRGEEIYGSIYRVVKVELHSDLIFGPA